MSLAGMFMLNIVLALLWTLMWGTFDMGVFLSGFVLGYLLLGLFSRTFSQQGYGRKGWQLFSFAAYFVRILIKANLQVAWEIITPRFAMQPRLLRYPVSDLSPAQLTTLANAITLTPGTLSVDVTQDKNWLYVHCMYARDNDQAIAELTELRDRIMDEVFG